jgi:hypothetical protein
MHLHYGLSYKSGGKKIEKQECCCVGGWRNGLVFDPLAEYGSDGLSYADFFLYPLADALSQVIDSTTNVLFAMQVCTAL